MAFLINGVTLAVGEKEESLPGRAAALLSVSAGDLASFAIVRRSLDARRSRPPRFVYLLKVDLGEGVEWSFAPQEEDAGISISDQADIVSPQTWPKSKVPAFSRSPVVVGSGPAGIFAALAIAERGVPVILLERGRPVPERVHAVEEFWRRGVLNPENNVCFGEGGAGTFSDGKLTSRGKNPRAALVKQQLVEAGAPAGILVDSHPHIGTDRLRSVVVNMRKRLIERGGEVRFASCVTDFLLHQDRIAGVVVNGNEEILTDHLLVAIGQSASDTYRRLEKSGIAMAPKAFAAGLRVEHPQELINRIQYGRWAGLPELPPAEYFLTAKIESLNRSVYSFCMCPGGTVIGCSESERGVVVNGMSALRRDGVFANSAVVVNIRVEDLEGGGPLAGLDFRRKWEERAFTAGGADYCAPAQMLVDFVSGRRSVSIRDCSFHPGVKEADFSTLLPAYAVSALKMGFREFERKMPGFISGEAVLIGVETRTSSPVRILRGDDGQSVNIRGLYPCGEGAGYSGGIISSALDGIKAAQFLLAPG